MNEKIAQLMKVAGTDCSGKWMGIDHAERFANLIIEECIDVIWNNVPILGDDELNESVASRAYCTAMNDCMNLIEDHFGVEE